MLASTTVLDVTNPELERARPLRAPRVVPDDIDLMLLCDDGAPVVCDDIDLCAGPASDCTYAAGDPINLRDPWRLGVQTSSPAPQTGSHPCPTAQNPGQTCWDEDPEPEPQPAPPPAEVDEDGCAVGAGGSSCRRSAAARKNLQEAQAWRREQEAERFAANEAEREQRAAEERERGLWDRAKQAAQDAWDAALRAKQAAENRVGEFVEDVTSGAVHGAGLPQPSLKWTASGRSPHCFLARYRV